jgi:uncharacterized membrane protein YedE/YeeE
MNETKYMNPYLAGFLLGLLIVVAVFIAGEGLGASGAVKGVVIYAMDKVAPSHTENLEFAKSYLKSHPEGALKSWLIFEILGALIGAFISGSIYNRLKLYVEHSPGITSKQRIIAALIGGTLFGIGSQFGRGCTSGAALSGMSVFSTGGIFTMIVIFGTGYIVAYFFRKLWIN